MKSLRESLLDDDLIDKPDKIIRDEIKAFLKENYIGSIKISRKPNTNGKYEVLSTKNVEVKNKNITSLTNGTFIWTIVDGSFIVEHCNYLKSLEGAPEKVDEYFSCSYCNSLESLESAPKEVSNFYCVGCRSLKTLKGAPKEVDGIFSCFDCQSLTSLEGAPKEVGGNFNCMQCGSLKTLEGVSQIVNRNFYCNNCSSLTSLKGAPKEIGGNFYCYNCASKFKKISNVKGAIMC